MPIAGGNAVEAQAHASVFVVVDFGQPRRGVLNVDAQLFVKFALQRRQCAFAGFHLAASKFPITGIRLTRRARAKQKRACGLVQHASHHMHAWALGVHDLAAMAKARI